MDSGWSWTPNDRSPHTPDTAAQGYGPLADQAVSSTDPHWEYQPSRTNSTPPAGAQPGYAADPQTSAARVYYDPVSYPTDPPALQAPVPGYSSSAVTYGPSLGRDAAPAYGFAPFPPPAAVPASGATAIIAGVLALLIAAFRAFKTYGYFLTAQAFSNVPSGYPNHTGGAEAFSVVAAIVSAVGTVALVVGALMLFNRSLTGAKW